MIIQEINATVNGNSLSGEVIVPSPVLTSTKQEENGDLTKSPNFQLKLTGATPDMNIIDTVQVEFTNGDFNYTANMNVINKLQNGTVTLQYVDGLTVEEADSSDDSSDDEQTETLAMEISNPQGSPYAMEYDGGSGMPMMDMPITVDEITLGVSDDNGYTAVVDMIGTMGFPLPPETYDYLTPTNISGNNHCSLSWEMGGLYVTSSDNSQWSDDITVEFELNDQNSSCTILGDEWTGNYSSFEEFVATLPESIQPYVTNNAENRPELPLSVWNGCTANVYFTVEFNGAPDEPTQPLFTYSGSDQNDPIQVNVDLTNYPGGEIDSVPAPEVNINFVAPSSDYDWNNSSTWGNYEELNSNDNNDYMLRAPGNFDGTWTLGDGGYGYTGPITAGTYLRSYSVTFTNDDSYAIVGGGDPVAQALDGTTITFWVQYNVTGTIPQPE